MSKCSQRSSSSAARDLWGGLQGFCRVSRFIALHVPCYQLIFADSCTLSSLPLQHLVARVSIFSGKLFPLIFLLTVPVSGRSFGWFPILGLPWIPPCGYGIWHPANLEGTSSQAHLFVMSLISKTTTLHVHHACLYFFAIVALLRLETDFTFCGGSEHPEP